MGTYCTECLIAALGEYMIMAKDSAVTVKPLGEMFYKCGKCQNRAFYILTYLTK